MRRFLTRGVRVDSIGTGADYHYGSPLYFGGLVQIVSGQYSVRTLRSFSFRIPALTTSLYDSTTAQRIYTRYCWGGDEELSISEKCAYGTAGGPGFRVSLFTGIDDLRGESIPISGSALCEFRVLYYL